MGSESSGMVAGIEQIVNQLVGKIVPVLSQARLPSALLALLMAFASPMNCIARMPHQLRSISYYAMPCRAAVGCA